jgi:tetratricopeptide (TPR) repeat protein
MPFPAAEFRRASVEQLVHPALVSGDAFPVGKGNVSDVKVGFRPCQRAPRLLSRARFRELDPTTALPHAGLGNVLTALRQLEAAIQEYRKAIELDPKDSRPHKNLGNVFSEKQQLDAAIQEYRKAIDLDPKNAEAHCNLADTLRQKGLLMESLDEYRKGHRLGSNQPGWRHPSAQWVRTAERLVELDGKLAAILEGKETLANDRECLALAQLCQQPFQQRYAASCRFYTEAFAHDTKLADDM